MKKESEIENAKLENHDIPVFIGLDSLVEFSRDLDTIGTYPFIWDLLRNDDNEQKRQ